MGVGIYELGMGMGGKLAKFGGIIGGGEAGTEG